jgi:SPX domain protein involved in polyphosphate accumulation
MLRYERKYLVANQLLDAIRNRMEPFVNIDSNTILTPEGLREYTVRSIYFDSRNLSIYREKQEGLLLRRKFRIRGYNGFGEDNQVVFEIKRKIENRILKHRGDFMYRHVDKVLDLGEVDKHIIEKKNRPEGRNDALRFMYHIKKFNLIPSCLIVYEREAWHGRLDPGVRITFDKNIRSHNSPMLKDLYKDTNFNHLFPDHFIMEIKYFTDQMPLWARSITQEFRLRHDALSKYTLGFDASVRLKKVIY